MTPDLHALAGAYALNAVDDRERADFEAHLQTCSDCRAEVRGLAATAARLGASGATAPPVALRARVLAAAAAVAASAQPGPEEIPSRERSGAVVVPLRPTRRVVVALGSLAAAFALLAGTLGVVAWQAQRRADQVVAEADRVATVVAAPDAVRATGQAEGGGNVTVVASPARGEMVVLAEELPAVPADRTYQLWLIGEDVRSAGLVRPEGGRVRQLAAGDMDDVTAVGMSVEPAHGSRMPSTDPVVVLSLRG